MRKKRTIILSIILAAVLALSGCGLSEIFRPDGSLSTLDEAQSEAEASSAGQSEEASGESADVSAIAESAPNATESYPEAETAAADLTGFDYDQLSADDQSLYAQLYSGISEKKSTFSVMANDTSRIGDVIQAVLADHPEFFWIDGGVTYRGIEGIPLKLIELDFNIDASQIPQIQSQIDAQANSFLAEIQPGWGEYDIAKAAYEWVIFNTDYQLNSPQDQNIQSVFLNHVSVCAGYAKALQYLLTKAGVWCAYIQGTVGDGNTHAWNAVRIDGTFTLVDVTWGDPTYDSSAEEASKLKISYNTFCVTSGEMNRTHVPSEKYTIPDCTSTYYDYYRLNGMFYDSSTDDVIQQALWNSVDNNISYTYMKFSRQDLYEDALRKVEEGSLLNEPLQKRLEWDGKSTIKYYYSHDDSFYIVKIYWEQ